MGRNEGEFWIGIWIGIEVLGVELQIQHLVMCGFAVHAVVIRDEARHDQEEFCSDRRQLLLFLVRVVVRFEVPWNSPSRSGR